MISPDVQVDLGVEVHQEDGGHEAEDDGVAPVDVRRVDLVDPKRRHRQLHPGHVHPLDLLIEKKHNTRALFYEIKIDATRTVRKAVAN